MPDYLCGHCLYGKKEYCGDKRFPEAAECLDFVHRNSIYFRPKGTKPGLEARHYVTTTADMMAKGELPYPEETNEQKAYRIRHEQEGQKTLNEALDKIKKRRRRQFYFYLISGIVVIAVLLALILFAYRT